jgi:hypothetical protein
MNVSRNFTFMYTPAAIGGVSYDPIEVFFYDHPSPPTLEVNKDYQSWDFGRIMTIKVEI